MRHLQRHIHLCQPTETFKAPFGHGRRTALSYEEPLSFFPGTVRVNLGSRQWLITKDKGSPLEPCHTHRAGPRGQTTKRIWKNQGLFSLFCPKNWWPDLDWDSTYFIHPPFFPILAANIKNSNLPKLASSEIQANVTEISFKTQQGSVRVWPCDKERTGYQWPKSQTWQLSRSAEPWPSTYTRTDPNS